MCPHPGGPTLSTDDAVGSEFEERSRGRESESGRPCRSARPRLGASSASASSSPALTSLHPLSGREQSLFRAPLDLFIIFHLHALFRPTGHMDTVVCFGLHYLLQFLVLLTRGMRSRIGKVSEKLIFFLKKIYCASRHMSPLLSLCQMLVFPYILGINLATRVQWLLRPFYSYSGSARNLLNVNLCPPKGCPRANPIICHANYFVRTD